MDNKFLQFLIFALLGFALLNFGYAQEKSFSVVDKDCDPTKPVEVTKDIDGKNVKILEYPEGCRWEYAIATTQKLIKFIITELAPALALIFILWGGFLMMLGGPISSNISKGKNIIYTALIGYVLVLVSGFIIDLALGFLAGGNISGLKFKYK